MINLYNQVPTIYTNASRDFQYLSWLLNVVLNSVKHNIDDIYNLPNTNSDPKITELLALTLGFKVKRNYDKTQLIALVAALPSVLRYKGTEKAILMAAEALVRAAGSHGGAYVDVEGVEVVVTLPKDLVDITLFLDLLDYILPAGMTCRVIRQNKNTKKIDDIQIKHSDELNTLVVGDIALANLYSLENTTYNQGFYANIHEDAESKFVNVGLLDNTVIPTLDDASFVKAEQEYENVILRSTEADGTHSILTATGSLSGVNTILKAKKDRGTE